jgi:hypothetical protein
MYNYTITMLLQDPRDIKGTGGHTDGDIQRDARRTGGHTRGMQEAPGGPEVKHGGIGAGRRTTGTHHQHTPRRTQAPVRVCSATQQRLCKQRPWLLAKGDGFILVSECLPVFVFI